jgi:cyclase
MRQLTPNVYIKEELGVFPKFRGCDSGFVTTSEGIVMIDSPMLPTDAVRWRDEIAKRGQVRFIISTHHHLDHIAGNFFFSGSVIFHEGCREIYALPLTRELDSEVPGEPPKVVTLDPAESYRLRVKELDPEGLPFLKQYQLRPPEMTFSERLRVDVGGHTFELTHMPGHTKGDVCVYIPQEKVFFAGDNFTNGAQPSLSQCLPLEWIESLKKIEKIDSDFIVPGHGKVSSKKDVQEFRSFIEKCVERVREAIQKGMSPEEAADRISFLDLYIPIHPGPWQQRMNVLRLYEKLKEREME